MVAKGDMDRASEVEAAYRVREGLYLLGSLERGVQSADQGTQSRLVLQRNGGPQVGRVAVVGGGISGVTAPTTGGLRKLPYRSFGMTAPSPNCAAGSRKPATCGPIRRFSPRSPCICAKIRCTRWPWWIGSSAVRTRRHRLGEVGNPLLVRPFGLELPVQDVGRHAMRLPIAVVLGSRRRRGRARKACNRISRSIRCRPQPTPSASRSRQTRRAP